MISTRKWTTTAVAFAIASLVIVPEVKSAGLTLTSAGVADGFTLSTFATMNPGNTGCCGGPFGVAVAANGTVLVADLNLNKVFTFNDMDGQTPATTLKSLNGNWSTIAATAVGNTFWSAALGNTNAGGTFTTYSTDLTTITPQTVNTAGGSALHPYLGMATTPDGHVVATTDSGQLIEITPGNSTARVIANFNALPDGVSVSPDGTQIVVEVGGNVNVYNRSTGALLHTYSPGNQPDGTGVISKSGSPLNGDIIAAGNDGSVVLIDNMGVSTTIATGGTRLDYTSVDPTNGSILIDSSDSVYRLSCDGCFGGTPEPATFSLLGTGLLGVFLVCVIRAQFR